jgi:SAM-dependent methyltransferase
MLVKTQEKAVCERHAAADRIPGHWLLASLGKKVLRPGGIELTMRMLDALSIGPADDVLEFAPGLGVTARMALTRRPSSFFALDRDATAAEQINEWLQPLGGYCLQGTAESTALPDGVFSAVYGEAMLSMPRHSQKERILGEARRLLRPGGRYGIHELCLIPDEIGDGLRAEIERSLSAEIHHGVCPITHAEWREMLAGQGFAVEWEGSAPMHLLEPARMVRDEGLGGAIRIALNLVRKPAARRRVFAMWRLFRRYQPHLAAVSFVCRKVS